jgi:hypothetical protein
MLTGKMLWVCLVLIGLMVLALSAIVIRVSTMAH